MPTLLRVAAAVAVTLLGASACNPGDTQGEMSPDKAAAVQVVERYVAAVGAGRLEAAAALQCSEARVAPADREQFRDQLERFTETAGRVTGARAMVIPDTGMEPVADHPNKVEVSYRIVIAGDSHDELLAATVTENGKRVVCGRSPRASKQLHRQLPEQLRPNTPTSLSPRDLAAALSPPPGFSQTQDKELPKSAESRPGEQQAWTRVWQTGTYGGGRVTVIRYDSDRHALDAGGYYLKRLTGDGTQLIESGVPGAAGVRILGYAWLGIQPPDEGPYVDHIYLLYGNMLVSVGIANLPTGSDHALTIELARQAHAAAAR